MDDIAICCMSGGYKNVFTHGVLRAFEEKGIRAKAYASCSSSVLIAAFAAFNKVSALDLSLWSDGYATSQAEGNQSGAMRNLFNGYRQRLKTICGTRKPPACWWQPVL